VQQQVTPKAAVPVPQRSNGKAQPHAETPQERTLGITAKLRVLSQRTPEQEPKAAKAAVPSLAHAAQGTNKGALKASGSGKKGADSACLASEKAVPGAAANTAGRGAQTQKESSRGTARGVRAGRGRQQEGATASGTGKSKDLEQAKSAAEASPWKRLRKVGGTPLSKDADDVRFQHLLDDDGDGDSAAEDKLKQEGAAAEVLASKFGGKQLCCKPLHQCCALLEDSVLHQTQAVAC
jgi:hypothetical protein